MILHDNQHYLPLGDARRLPVDPYPAMIDELLNRFEFPIVQTAMQSVGWTYFGESDTPSLEVLRAAARELLEGVALEQEMGAELQSGGFRAAWYPSGSLVLTFVLAFGSASRGPAEFSPELARSR